MIIYTALMTFALDVLKRYLDMSIFRYIILYNNEELQLTF